ncbi:hypothetical protein FB561_3199 [Kribbella amoyensis]|uniref:Uncharacterized protein n=1 Tax=Kribbella amoyensis TaxID=996641 RepID=A0A561BTF7_9ACTN|nr:hypothetical protein [Kribbella amoyensis]TWD82073.1 hypothetical protein FB561_3199 [Kribbella amoyensis]
MFRISGRNRSGARVAVAWLAAATLLATGCTAKPDAGSAVQPAANTSPSDHQPTPSETITTADLTAAGFRIVPTETTAVAPKPGELLITEAQADRMIAEQRAGGGLLGTEVDRLAPMPAGSPPLSYLVAAWIARQPTDAAKVAHRLMGDRGWKHAGQVVFPLAVLTLFVTDFTRPLTAAPTPTTTQPTTPGPVRSTGPSRSGVRPAAVAFDPCTDITNFLANALKTVFDALKLKPASSGGFWTVVSWLADVWNFALGLAQGIVQAVVDKLTRPLFDALRSAIGALTVATLVISYFTKQSLRVALQPAGPYRFAVGAEPDVTGEFVAVGDKLTASWPDALVKCAQVAGKKLPEVVAAGSPATWKVIANDGVITPGPLAGQVGSDRTARLRFATGRETAEDAAGTPVTGRAVARIEVERKEIRDLLGEVKNQVRGVLSSLLPVIPPAILNGIFDPLLNVVEAELAARAGGIFAVAGSGSVTVLFHKPVPKPTPTPTPSKPGRGDFCTQYRAMAKWSSDHQAQPTPEAWAGELVRRLTAMRPLAPADKLVWVDALLRVYRLVATGAGAAAIGNEAAASNFPAAGTGLARFCKVDPALLQPR